MTAPLDAAAVRHIARLARLRVDPADEDRLVAEMARIVEYVGVLESLPEDAAGPPPPPAPTPLREDRVTNEPRPDDLLAAAPDRDGTHLKVPAVIREAT